MVKDKNKADIIVLNKVNEIRDFTREGGKHSDKHFPSWTEGEKELRNQYILDLIVQSGMSVTSATRYLKDQWGLHSTRISAYCKEAINSLITNREDTIEQARTLHLERLESLYQKAVEQGSVSQALKVLEQLGKVYGLYTDTVVVAPKLEFSFGGDNNIISGEGRIIRKEIQDGECNGE